VLLTRSGRAALSQPILRWGGPPVRAAYRLQ